MKKMIFLATCLMAFSARADIIKCSFTEPFYNFTYSMAQQKLTISGAGVPTRTIRNVGFQIVGSNSFVIGSVSSPRLRLTLNNRGSDGMSDFVYPYVGVAPNFGNHGTLTGGCESNYLRKRMGN